MSAEVCVTGLGLVTAGGVGVEDTWATVCAGTGVARTDPELAGLPVDFSCRVPTFDRRTLVGRRAWQYDRFVQFAIIAAREAIADAGLDPRTWDGARVAVVVGVGIWGVTTSAAQTSTLLQDGAGSVSALVLPMMLPNMVAGCLGIELGATGPNLVTATACASGTTAIGFARDLLRRSACDVAVAGGAEAAVSPLIIAGFTQMGALAGHGHAPGAASRPFDAGRDGFVLGEGSGMLVLERTADAKARGASVRARVLGFGSSADAYHLTTPDPDGIGVETAIRHALADADLAPGDVDHVNAHATATPVGDLAEAGVIRRVLGHGPTVTSVKGTMGHPLGAAGAIETALTVLSMERGLVPPTANLDHPDPDIDIDIVTGAPRPGPVRVALNNSFGFGGQNAVLALAAA
jgi:3-oxoacyl-(acyl-carrier-protein) synthase